MNVLFENDFQKKVMHVTFPEPTTLADAAGVRAWRTRWTEALGKWHSPYKALVDCTPLTVTDAPDVRTELERMGKFLKGFFLKSAVGFGRDESKGHDLLFFEVMASEEDASKAVGLKGARAPANPEDFRANIQITNHFQQHVMELAFAHPVVIDTKEKLDTIRSKITNNLMQWHSKWSLLVDCANVQFTPETAAVFEHMEKVLRGFFMKRVIGYAPSAPKETYPFEVFRARHNAAARLEAEGAFSGDAADCRSRKG